MPETVSERTDEEPTAATGSCARAEARLRAAARASALFAGAVGVLVLIGWLLDFRPLMQVLPGQVAMVPNAAVAFVLASLALWWRAGIEARSSVYAAVAAATCGLLGLLALAEYVSSLSFGIDELLFRDRAGLTGVFPGRMAVPAAISFVAIGSALLLSNQRRARWAAEALALIPGLFALISLVGYAYGVGSIYWLGTYKGMAIHTAAAFLVLSLGVLLSRGDRGFARLIISDTVGGKVARRILPVALFVPLVLGWLRVVGQRAGLYGTEFGRALYAVSNSVVLLAIFWGISAALMRADQERRRAELALEESERRYRDLAAFAPIGISRSTPGGRFISVNAAFARLLGYESIGEVLQLDIGRDVYFDNSEGERLIAEHERLGGIAAREVRLKRKDGSPVWVRLAFRAVADESGKWTSFEGFFNDITESKEAEDSLRKAEEQYRLLFENSPHPMWVVDRETLRHVAVNDAAIEHYGYSREEFLSMDIGQILPAGDAAAALKAIPKEESGLEKMGIWRHVKRDGSLISVEIATHSLTFSGRPAWLVLAYDVTDRLQAEKSLRESEQRYRSLFESMLHGFAHCEMLFEDGEPRDFVYLDVNATFEKLTGLTGVVGKRVTQVIPGIRESSPELFEIYGRVARTGAPEKFEMFVDALGIWFSISAYSPRKDHFVALFDNITERKRAEEGQKASEQRIRALMENAKDAIFVSNQEGIVLEVNRAAVQLQGRPRSDIVGRPVVDMVAPKERASVRQKFEETLSQGSLEGFETLALRADGTTVPIEVSASLVEVRSARLVHAIVRDVSERKRAEREMRRSQERFRRLFESNTIGIAIADLGGRTLEANDAYLEMIGHSREELLEGKIRWERITPPEHLARDHAAVEQLQRTGVATPWEKELLRKDGTRVPVLLGIAMLDASEASCIAYIVDLSARRQLEEQLRLAQKMEAIGQLAGGIAHDFNNLLTAILGYSDILAGRLGPDDPGLEDLEEIRRAGERAAALTRQLLAFGRRQVLEPRVLNVNDLIANLEKMLVRVIGEDVALQTRLRLDVSNVLVDPGQLEQVLMNLVVNARDAMPRGGKLTIETANAELSKDYALGHIPVQPGSYVMIAVTDTGIGMDDATRARIFEPFFTTKEKGKGTGLGLATAYGIIKQSGGYIWAYSEEGRGTTFKVYLPRVAAEPTDRASAVVGAPAGGTETILLVEDEESVRTLTRKLLEGYGYKVLEAPSGEQGIAVATARVEPIDLLLTDMVMPDMGGADLAARVLALRPEIRVLYTSGYTDDAIFRHSVLDETAPFLQKPFTPEALARKVREVLG